MKSSQSLGGKPPGLPQVGMGIGGDFHTFASHKKTATSVSASGIIRQAPSWGVGTDLLDGFAWRSSLMFYYVLRLLSGLDPSFQPRSSLSMPIV